VSKLLDILASCQTQGIFNNILPGVIVLLMDLARHARTDLSARYQRILFHVCASSNDGVRLNLEGMCVCVCVLCCECVCVCRVCVCVCACVCVCVCVCV